ncbi:MAG: polyphosphate polymerase domain-containing protein [Candidatus Bathyarchaeia archaeon]|jgi:hypothetical protein
MTEQNKQHLRHELKYPLDNMQYQLLRKNLATVLKPDPHMEPDGSYHIRSLYFDDIKNSAYFDKIAGVPRRKKYRIRIYNFSDKFIKLERKTKLNQYINKQWVKLTREEADKILVGNIDFLSNSSSRLLREFYCASRCSLLRPVALVDYRREAFVCSIGNVRITFDIGLQTNLGSIALFDQNVPMMPVDEEFKIILEIKYDDFLPLHIRGLFLDTIKPQAAIGKFALCRELTNALTGCSVTRI